MVIKIRKKLMDKKYAQYGPEAIRWQLHHLGIEPPSLSTIKRIIKRNNLVKKDTQYQKKGTPYPALPVLGPNSLHQVDFWGARYISGDGRLYCLNVMDVHTRRVTTYPARHKRNQEALEGIIKAWKHLGQPDYMQFDNALAFRGSNRHPRSFGPVIRWCLYHNVEPIFIPLSEPWRNGHLEKFHDSLEKKFFREIKFNNFKHFCVELEEYIDYHNSDYHYSPLGGHTPDEIYERDHLQTERLNKDYEVPDKIPIRDGAIHVIRLIRSDLKLNIFSEEFDMPDELKYEYVVATICTDAHFIKVQNSQRETLFTIPYRIPIK